MGLKYIGDHVFKLNGVISFKTAPEITKTGVTLLEKKFIEYIANQNKNEYLIDLIDLDTANSLVLSILLAWFRVAKKYHMHLKVINMPDQLNSLTEWAGMSGWFK